MLTKVTAGPYTLRGVSVGGVYTSLSVRELGVLFDVGIPIRSFAAIDDLLLSHGHADHLSGLVGMLGIRGMLSRPPPRVFLPAEIEPLVQDWLRVAERLQRFPLEVETVAMRPGEDRPLRADLHVRAFRTHHPVPSLGYQLLRRVAKLKAEYRGLPGAEIQRLKAAGAPLFDTVERLELCYATDTLVRVLDTNPSMCRSRVLVLECTFLDETKSLEDARAGCHVHLDELLERVDRFENEHVVLMHFSQTHRPEDVHAILDRRCPPALRAKLVPFAPRSGGWPG